MSAVLRQVGFVFNALDDPRSNAYQVLNSYPLDSAGESDDWRGDLPRHLMKFLPKATGVLLYARDSKYLDCKICSSIGVTTKQNCQQLLGTGKNTQKADLLVVIGTGRLSACNDNNTNRAECSEDSNEHYPSLDNLLSHTSYTHNKTLTVHIPVRKLRSLFNNQVFNFRHVIQDYDFMKPIAMETCREMARYCQHTKKAKRLLYVGRYVEKKACNPVEKLHLYIISRLPLNALHRCH